MPVPPASSSRAPLPFMYKKVKRNDFGLTAAEILDLEDTQLNRYVVLCVCVCVCVCVWMYVCMYVRTYVCKDVYTWA